MELNASYDILRFDAVMFDNSITKTPMIYIKPDLAFLDFVAQNNNQVLVVINDSDSIYDNKEIIGVVDSSCNIPSCRPNFFNKTGYYVITLYSNWYGYPKKLGKVSFKGLKVSSKVETYNKPKRQVQFNLEPEMQSKTYIIIYTVIAAIILILLCVFLYKCEKRSQIHT